jgi:hypothetical protein
MDGVSKPYTDKGRQNWDKIFDHEEDENIVDKLVEVIKEDRRKRDENTETS